MTARRGRVFVGMSGFSYPAWMGSFYPAGTRRSEMLERYAERFGAVEVNTTFRRMPDAEVLERWGQSVPEGFRFALKAHQRITHTKRLRDVASDIAELTSATARLGDRLGPLLLQTPPKLHYEPTTLRGFLAELPSSLRWAFEARDPSFDVEGVDELLREFGVARCLNDEHADVAAHRPTTGFAYLRLRKEDYDEAGLHEIAKVICAMTRDGADVYAFFRHLDRPDAPDPALRLRELVS